MLKLTGGSWYPCQINDANEEVITMDDNTQKDDATQNKPIKIGTWFHNLELAGAVKFSLVCHELVKDAKHIYSIQAKEKLCLKIKTNIDSSTAPPPTFASWVTPHCAE